MYSLIDGLAPEPEPETPAEPFIPDPEAIAKLQGEVDGLTALIEAVRRSQAVGRRQIPRRLPSFPAPLINWEGSFYGIPDDWAEALKPSPLHVRVLHEPVQEWSAMRIVIFPQIKDDGIWVKRGGYCKCFSTALHKTFKVKPKQHPYYAKCWRQRMVKLPPKEKDLTPVAKWRTDKRNPWGGYFMDVETKKALRGIPLPLNSVYQQEMTADDMALQQAKTRAKWAVWTQPVKPQTPAKPVVTLALLRAVRFVRMGLLRLRSEVTPPVNHWQELTLTSN